MSYLVYFYKVLCLVLVLFSCSYLLAIFWHILIFDIEDLESRTLDVYHGSSTFYSYYAFSESSDVITPLVKLCYFAVTTLSTIGYGDFSPKSVPEKFVGAFVLLLGVCVFSIVLSRLMDILGEFRKIEKVGEHKLLSKWIAMLSKFNHGNPLSKDTIIQIECFFDYYWTNNRMSPFNEEGTKKFAS